MKPQSKSTEIAECVGRKIIEDIGRQFCRSNLARSISSRRARDRYFRRVLELKTLGGLSDENSNRN